MNDTKITFIGRKEICENTYTFTFNLYNSDYDFKPGQYSYFTIIDPVNNEKSGNSRPLSIANSPHHVNSIMVAARKNQSAFVENLLLLNPGDQLYISEPKGEISLHSNDKIENVFIVGGIGITPVRSIVEFATENDLKNRITLFYSNKSSSNSAFINDLLEWSAENENFKFVPFFEKKENAEYEYETGRIDHSRLKKYLGNFENKIFNIIGPPEMITSVMEILLKEKVSEEYIKTEKFL